MGQRELASANLPLLTHVGSWPSILKGMGLLGLIEMGTASPESESEPKVLHDCCGYC